MRIYINVSPQDYVQNPGNLNPLIRAIDSILIANKVKFYINNNADIVFTPQFMKAFSVTLSEDVPYEIRKFYEDISAMKLDWTNISPFSFSFEIPDEYSHCFKIHPAQTDIDINVAYRQDKDFVYIRDAKNNKVKLTYKQLKDIYKNTQTYGEYWIDV